MDVAIPSNFERFSHDPTMEFSAGWADDVEIVDTIARVWEDHSHLLDPHTAAAWKVGRDNLGDRPQVVVATAHPAKFSGAVVEATGSAPELPEGYVSPMELPERFETIEPNPSALFALIR
jgi:threonine synthase